jgi:hypothetical protein
MRGDFSCECGEWRIRRTLAQIAPSAELSPPVPSLSGSVWRLAENSGVRATSEPSLVARPSFGRRGNRPALTDRETRSGHLHGVGDHWRVQKPPEFCVSASLDRMPAPRADFRSTRPSRQWRRAVFCGARHASKGRTMAKLGLLDRLASGPVICAEGYLFELERRGYLQAGAYVPEAVLISPNKSITSIEISCAPDLTSSRPSLITRIGKNCA